MQYYIHPKYRWHLSFFTDAFFATAGQGYLLFLMTNTVRDLRTKLCSGYSYCILYYGDDVFLAAI